MIFILSDDNKNLDSVKRGLYSAIRSLDLSNPKQVAITDHKECKTGEQRAWFHILCGLFGQEVGYNKIQMKRVIINEVFGTETVLGVEIQKSSETLKRDEYSQLIEQTYIKAAEMGIVLPPPVRGNDGA